MKVVIFNSTLSSKDPKRDIFLNFGKGVEYSGDKAFIQNELKYIKGDVGVVFGEVRKDKPNKAKLHKIKEEVINNHRPTNSLIMFDNPTIGRKLTNINRDNPYIKMGINSFLNDVGIFNNTNCSQDRWEQMKRELDIKVSPWRKQGTHILIILQKLYDASLRGEEKYRPINHLTWLIEVLKDLKNSTDRPIIVRPHPLSLKDPKEFNLLKTLLPKDGNVTYRLNNIKPIIEDLKDCWACITYTSGSAVDAIIEGVPTVTYNSGSMAYPICDHDVKNIENISIVDRNQWFYDLAYTQWHIDEMVTGSPWRHLKEIVNERYRST